MATVLVIDDHLPTRELLRALLEYKGHRVVLAGNGPAALACAACGPDLVLADVAMPGIDGFTLVRLLREHEACLGAAFVFMSASFDEAAARAESAKCGGFGYLPKPFEPDAVFGMVESALQARAA